MGLRVIGAGFGRTGTSSLKAALETLGFGPCDHMGEVFGRPERAALWEEAVAAKARGGGVDWERLYAGYAATADWPGVFFWRELTDAYPEAKVVLSVRDPERWYDSTSRTIFALRHHSEAARRVGEAFGDPSGLAWMPRLTDLVVWDGTFGGRFADKPHALRVFAEHRAAVEAAIPPGRLLVHEAGDGWEPLCRFLGVPLPAEPYPRLNDGAALAALLDGSGGLPDGLPPIRRA